MDFIYEKGVFNLLCLNCYLYFYGYSVGGINFLLVEVMNFELFIFVYDVGYNREMIEDEVMYFSDV